MMVCDGRSGLSIGIWGHFGGTCPVHRHDGGASRAGHRTGLGQHFAFSQDRSSPRTWHFYRGEHGPAIARVGMFPPASRMEPPMTRLRVSSATASRPRKPSVLGRLAHLALAVALGSITLVAVLFGGVARAS